MVPVVIAALNACWKIYPSRLEAAGIAVGLVGVLMLTQGAGFKASPAGLAAMVVNPVIAMLLGVWLAGEMVDRLGVVGRGGHRGGRGAADGAALALTAGAQRAGCSRRGC